MSIIKFTEGETATIRLEYDKGKKVDGDYGTQYMWSCNGKDDVFYASESLNGILLALNVQRGQEVTIEKVRKEGVDFPVFKVDGMTADDLTVTLGSKSLSPNHGDGSNDAQLDRIEGMLKALMAMNGIDVHEEKTAPRPEPVKEEVELPF